MIYLQKIIRLIGRIIMATFASFFIFVFIYMGQSVIGLLSYDFTPLEIFNYHIACYSLHIVSTCEIHYFWLMGFWLEALPDGVSSYLSKYGVFDFVNDFFAGYYSLLFIKGIFEYGIPSLTALLMFKFIWGDTKTKSKTERVYKEN